MRLDSIRLQREGTGDLCVDMVYIGGQYPKGYDTYGNGRYSLIFRKFELHIFLIEKNKDYANVYLAKNITVLC